MTTFIIGTVAIAIIRFLFVIIFWNEDNRYYRAHKGGAWEKRKYGAEKQGHTFWEKNTESPKGNFKVIETDNH